jgi:hypothetical protein
VSALRTRQLVHQSELAKKRALLAAETLSELLRVSQMDYLM